MKNALKATICGCIMMTVIGSGLASAQSYSAGLRYWHASFEAGPNDFGSEPFFIGYFGYHDAAYNVIGQVGYGDSWEEGSAELERLDLSLALTRNESIYSYGLGVRRINYEISNSPEELSYFGPELLLGVGIPIQESGFLLSLSGSFGIFWWDYTDSGSSSADGNTTGFSLDPGIAYKVDAVKLRTGYRYQQLAEDRPIYEEEFSGIYVEVGYVF